MTVPSNFRRNAAPPPSLILHKMDIPASDIELVDGVPVTRALRTLLAVAESQSVPAEQLRQAFVEATRTGKITRSEIAGAKSDPKRCGGVRQLEGSTP